MNIMIAGEGGQGIQTIAQMLAQAWYNDKKFVSYIPHYGVEMRMGISFAFIRVDNKEISYPKFNKANLIAVLSARELEISQKFITNKTRIINGIVLKNLLTENNISPKAINMLVLGIIIKELSTSEFRLDIEGVIKLIDEKYAVSKYLGDNIKALHLGFEQSPEVYLKKLLPSAKLNQFISDKDSSKEVQRFPNICKGCGLCIEKCPKQALYFSEKNINYLSTSVPDVFMDKCIACKTCEYICPDCAIKINKN